jgi:hypothetical protein
MNKLVLAALGTTVIALAACSDATTGTNNSTPTSNTTLMPSSMAAVYSATPVGFDELSTSFNSTGAEEAFLPDFNSHGDDHGFGGKAEDNHGPGFGLGLMGGGLGGFLLGDGLVNDHFFRFRTGLCGFQAGVGIVCADTTRNGKVISTKTLKYTTASGTLQPMIDSTTDGIELTATVKGSNTRRDSSTSSVDETSHQKVTGLTGASRTVNSESNGKETSTGTSLFGAFTATRTAGDTLIGVVIPKKTSTTTKIYPTAGTIIRSMSATVNIQNATLVTNRKETITYDGSATAKVVIVKDGVTQNCTLPLPHGKLTCS